MTNEIPLITFNSLYNILREERKNKPLQKLDTKFYGAIKIFLTDKKRVMRLLKETKQNDKLNKEKHIYKNSEKIILEILNLRCMKISEISIKEELFNQELNGKSSILTEETNLYKQIIENIKQIKI